MTKVTAPRMYGADWKMPRRKAFAPEGLTLGATVIYDGGTGQVWSAAPGPSNDWWWVVAPNGSHHLRPGNELVVVGQCNDTPINYTESENDMPTQTPTRKAAATRTAATKTRTTRKTAASKGKTAPVPAPAAPRWEDRKAARRALAAKLRADGVKLTPEAWAAAKAEAGIR